MGVQLPYYLIRGGSSKGVYFKVVDLPKDPVERDRLILAAMEGVGSGDLRQIDGLGGGTSLTAKVAIVGKSDKDNADLDFLFLQVVIGEGRLTDAQNCGNILAGVVPFAIDSGLITPNDPTTVATVNMVNSNSLCEVTIQTPNKIIASTGSAKVDGVPGTGAPIACAYFNTAGANTGALFPTGNIIDVVDGMRMTCVDNGMPVVNLLATDFGLTGYESKEELDKNHTLKESLERIRLLIGKKINLGDVSKMTVPKMCLLSPARESGIINTRTFLPHVCHSSIGVLAAFSTGTACLVKGGVAEKIVKLPRTTDDFSLEHPSGEFSMGLTIEGEGLNTKILKSTAIRTARIISKGIVYIPEV